ARDRLRREILEVASRSDLLAITHYHYDHYTPGFVDTTWIGSTVEIAEQLYQDKEILVKDFKNMVNPSQRRRGWLANRFISKLANKVEPADARSWGFGATNISFSDPVPHGEEGGGLGWVLMVKISHGSESVLYTSDVQGPMGYATLRAILGLRPEKVVIGGPPLYLKNFSITESALSNALKNLVELSKTVQTLIVDHHLLRSIEWREFLQPAYHEAQLSGHQVLTGAEFLGIPNDLLESRRRELYELYPPPQEFLKWVRLPKEKRRKTPPPL
ncbi:MAG: hypothetical protein QXF26_04210, partial [Candidatus Bathyarchaeia archaeon]